MTGQDASAICLRDRDKNSLRAPGATLPFSEVLGMPRTLAYPDFPIWLMPHLEMSVQLVFATAVMRLGRSQRHLPGSHARMCILSA